MMKSQQIPRDHWPKFFKDFSRIHLGQQANLWICSSDVGLMREAVGLPLIGVWLDRAAMGKDRIDVIIGDSPGAHVTHEIRAPKTVRLGTNGSGDDASLQIDAEDGTIAFVRLQTPAAKETPAAFS